MSDTPIAGSPDFTLPHAGGGAPAPARLVGDSEVLGELGRGGMGVIYRARHAGLNRVVALKMIRDRQLAGPDDVGRFRREAEAVAQLDHPNIVPIHEVGEHDGLPFFAMKLIEGGDLAQLLARPDRPPLRRLVGMLQAVAQAVHYAHQRGIIHRDLKPENILIDAGGEPHVTDFGLARRVEGGGGLTQSNAILGTPGYMAPEQATGRAGAVTTLTDVWALGAILYECLTGRPPFKAATPLETVLQVVEQEVVPPSRIVPKVDRDLEAVCLKCLARVPAGRYPSAAALADDLGRWLAGEPLSARPPGAAYVVWLWLRKNVRAALWVALIGALGGGTASLLYLGPILVAPLTAAARHYEELPSVPRPWLVHFTQRVLTGLAEPGPYVTATAGMGCRVIFCSLGLLAVLAARSRGLGESLAVGLGAGTIAGVVAYALAIGPFVTNRLMLGPQTRDIFLMTYGTMGPDVRLVAPGEGPEDDTKGERARALLLRRYPDLIGRPVSDAGRVLGYKMLADMTVSSYQAVWIGLLAAASVCIVPLVLQAGIAGALFARREGGGGPVFWPYYELSLAWTWLLLDVLSSAVLEPLLENEVRLTWIGTLALAALAGLVTVGVACRWGWAARWSVYLAWMATLTFLSANWDHAYYGFRSPGLGPSATALFVLLAYALAAMLLVRHYRRLRAGL